MAETEETLNRNWYKAAMGLRYTKEGLQQFVTDGIDKFHKNVLQKLPPNYQCNTCTIQNVLQCPTPGTCGGRPCRFHDNTDPTKQYSSCPNNICGVIRDEVKHVHRYKRPTFKNSDAQVWFNNNWELAKCFMPPGYSNSAAADDTDFSGLIGVILSHLDFQALIAENLNQPGNKLEKAREARNTIMHSPKMELSTIDMNRHFQLLTDVLSDKQHLQTLPKAQEAIKKLKELQQGLITMTVTDKEMIHKEYERLKKVTDDGVELIKEKTKESIDNIRKKQIEGIENLMIMANDSCQTLQKETKFGEECLKRAAAELTSEFERSSHEETKKAKKNIEEEKDVLVEDMKEEAKLQKLEIYNRTQSSIDRIKALQAERAMGPHQMVKDYDEKKKNLQKELIEHYSENGYCLSAIPALIDDEEVDAADIFDMPKMRIKQKSNKDQGSQKDKYITTISDLFQTDRQPTLRACISGKAGYGKTTFCLKILSSWCKLHTNQQAKSLQSDDQNFLKSFDFLFYIPLRNHTTPDIIDMIKAELVRTDMHDILDEVLRRDSRKCFIILDGLDEWLLHEDCGKRIPIFDTREKMTILVTSRPWKLEVLRPKNREIGQEIKLCGVTDESKCIMAVVDYLNKKGGEKKIWEDTFKEEFRHMWHLFKVPTLLTQIVCMWYDDMDFGKTRVEVYCRMIDYYLQMANKRQQDKTKQNSHEFSRFESRKTENDCLLDIFRDLPFCKKYSDLLSKLSDLAFHTLFCEKREYSLVFPHSVTEIQKLDELDLTFCLKAGLLSQARFCSKVTEQTKKLSFIHKTVQEFLAAVFIAHNDDKFKYMLQRLSCLEHVLEMGEFMRLLSGLRPDMIYDMSKHIADLTDKDEKVTIYRQSITNNIFEADDDFDDFYEPLDIDSLIFDLVEEGCRCNKGKVVNKVIIRDLFFIHQDIWKKGNDNLRECIKGDEVKSFTMEYAYSFEILGTEKVTLWWNKFNGATLCKVSFIVKTQADVDHLIHVIQNSFSSLTSLGVKERRNHRPIHLDYQRFFTTFMDTSCLTCICLSCIKFDHSGIEQLGQFLSIKTQLEELKLESICCVTCVHAPCEYRIDLTNHRKLLKIHILHMTGLVRLCEGLPLQCCEVIYCNCGPSVIERLKSCETLQLLRVSEFDVDQVHRCAIKENGDREASPSSSGLSRKLIRVIPTLRNLRKLLIRNIDFGQDLLRLSSDMKYLRIIRFDACTQTLESFKCFISTLPKTQHQLEVNLEIKLTSPNNSDEALMAVNYLLERYHTSKGGLKGGLNPYEEIITFENENHDIFLDFFR